LIYAINWDVTSFTVFFVGTAGSGKSTLVSAYSEWLEERGFDVAVVNLDPAADYLPYAPDVDIRDHVDARRIMKRYRLGPNGAIIAAIDMAISEADRIKEEVEAIGAPVVLFDTPGQMELFAFRETGAFLVSKLSGEKSAIVFVMDGVYVGSVPGLAASLLLALSARVRFGRPMVPVVNKVDLIGEDSASRIIEMFEDIDSVIESLPSDADREVVRLVLSLGGVPTPIPVSAVTRYGFEQLYYSLQLIYTGGEDTTY